MLNTGLFTRGSARMCLLGVLVVSVGCQALLDRTVNNTLMFPGVDKIQHYAGGGTLGDQWTQDGQCREQLCPEVIEAIRCPPR